MPSFSSKVELTSAASSSGLAIADVEFIKGAFYTVAEYDDLADIPIARVSDGQIVWVEDASSNYQATVTPADFINGPFVPTVTWSEFTGFGSGGGGGSGDITAVIAGDGLTGGSFTGTAQLDIGAGNGITVGSDSISVTAYNGITVDSNGVSVNPYNGITVDTNGVSLNTGSAHFTEAVQKTDLDGGTI
jgi:hypothetical protein